MTNSIGLYIHIPFCHSKCPYCDFFSVRGKNVDFSEYTSDLKNSIDYWSNINDKPVSTIYFGGGTPSVLGADLLSDILQYIKSKFEVLDNAEITFEVNPKSGMFFDFYKAKNAGFNRVSVGLQSANINELKILGRPHNIDDAKNTVGLIKNSGIENISLDLMMGIPYQTLDSLKNSIDFCISLGVQHISSYILKLEKNTVFYKMKNRLNLPDDDYTADLYMFAVNYLDRYGYKQYEVSNFSKLGYESKHNMGYWLLKEYIGIGPGAHSYFNGKRFYYNNSFEEFKDNIILEDGNGGTEEEYIMLSLRLKKGLVFSEYKKIFGHDVPEDLINKALKFETADLLRVSSHSISLTTKGFLVSNSIIAELI